MKMSVADIIADARSAWIEPSATFITATEALRWVNQAQADFCRRVKCLRTSAKIDCVEDQQEYELTEASRISAILWVLYNGKPLWPTTIAELTAFKEGWRQSAGGETNEPKFYYISGISNAEFGLYPCPDSSTYDIYLYFAVNPAVITDTGAYPEIPEKWHDILVYFTEWKGHRKNRDWQSAGGAYKAYMDAVAEAHVDNQTLQPERPILLSGPEYREPIGKLQRPQWPSGYGVEF